MKREVAARLAHDVGKYIARTAHNLAPGSVLDGELVEMLVRDLFELGNNRQRASALLREIEQSDPQLDPALDDVRALLAEADALEARLRSGERAAVERGCAIALEVERRLRALAREAAA